jgi:hypothetical protein
MNLIEGKTISIAIGGAVGLSCVVSEMVHAKLITITEKAIQIQCQKDSIWIPKKALEKKTDWYKLKKWFKPDAWQSRFFDKYSSIGGVTANY